MQASPPAPPSGGGPPQPSTREPGLGALDEGGEISLDALLRLVGVVRRRWWLLVVLPLVAASIGSYHVLRQPLVYRASSTNSA